MQRTVFDQVYTPGQADKNLPGLKTLYPTKSHSVVTIPHRDAAGRRRVRVVIQLRKRKG